MTDCPFCDIIAKRVPATFLCEWNDAIAIEPLNPVVSGHVLIIPRRHVQTFFSDPEVSAATMRRASEFIHGIERHHEPRDHNVITSAGRAATQTVMHLHVHIVPRREGDGLALPWTSQSYEETWVNAMSAVSPSDEFLRDVGRSVIGHLRQQPTYPKEVIIKFRSKLMAHEWAEELADLAREHHNIPDNYLPPDRTILTREQMAAGERTKTTPPMVGDIRPVGEGRWMQYDGEHWGPCENPHIHDMLPRFTAARGGIRFEVIHSDIVEELRTYKPMPVSFTAVVERAEKALEKLAVSFGIPIDLLRGDSDD